MRFAPLATALSLAVAAIAAPTPNKDIGIDGLIGVDASFKRDAVSEEDLTVNAAGLHVHTKRDVISDAEAAVQKFGDDAIALTEAASRRDARPEEHAEGNFISVGSASASIKRDAAPGVISDLESEAGDLVGGFVKDAEAVVEEAS